MSSSLNSPLLPVFSVSCGIWLVRNLSDVWVWSALIVCVPDKGLALYLMDSIGSVTWGRSEGHFTEIFNRVSKQKKLLTRSRRALQTCYGDISTQLSIRTVESSGIRLLLTSWLFAAMITTTYTHGALSQEHGTVHNLRSKLCIHIYCEIWLHGKFKASNVGYNIVILKAG